MYLRPNPDSDKYVDAGGSVSDGQVVCLIEAMKVFNEIKSEGVSGTIKKVCVEDGQAVEYGTVLFLATKFQLRPIGPAKCCRGFRLKIPLDCGVCEVFKRILIANRGEIALRIIRTCRRMGIEAVVVHSTADKDSLPVRLADESICIGPPASGESYLNINNIIAAAELADVDAIHPGYGFLAENAHFAEVVRDCKIEFIGPTAQSMRAMGDKAKAKALAKQAGVPTVLGTEGPVANADEALAVAQEIGYPVMIGRRWRWRPWHARGAQRRQPRIRPDQRHPRSRGGLWQW